LAVEVRIAERAEGTELRVAVHPLDRVGAHRLQPGVTRRHEARGAERPREPARPTRVLHPDGDRDSHEGEHEVCRQAEVPPDLAVERDVAVRRGGRGQDLDADEGVEGEEQGRTRDPQAIGGRDHHHDAEQQPRERVAVAGLGEVEDIEQRRVHREHEDRDHHAGQAHRDLAPRRRDRCTPSGHRCFRVGALLRASLTGP
jgi:hypothetical protein